MSYVEHPVRIVFVGGPYDGYEWFPNDGWVTHLWAEEPVATGAEELKVGYFDVATAPTQGNLVDDDMLVMDGPLGVASYLERGERDLWDFSPESFVGS